MAPPWGSSMEFSPLAHEPMVPEPSGPALGPSWDVLGASSWLIFRFLSLSRPLLAHFWLLLVSLNLLLWIFFDFPSPRALPEPQKSMKKHWFSYVFCYFRVLLKIAENRPKIFPKDSQDPPKPFQDLPKMPQDSFKTAPRRPRRGKTHPMHAQSASKTHQDCPRRTQTPQR